MRGTGLARLAAALLALGAGDAAAEEWAGCFAGADANGAPARLALQAERLGDWFEVRGNVASASIGVMQIKADGWSGAGRMFRNHEGEGGALYINLLDFTGASVVLHVDGYGSFPFRAVPC